MVENNFFNLWGVVKVVSSEMFSQLHMLVDFYDFWVNILVSKFGTHIINLETIL